MDDSTRTLVIRRSNDETFDLFLDGAFITSTTYYEHGMEGVEAVTKTAEAIGKAFGADVIREDIR